MFFENFSSNFFTQSPTIGWACMQTLNNQHVKLYLISLVGRSGPANRGKTVNRPSSNHNNNSHTVCFFYGRAEFPFESGVQLKRAPKPHGKLKPSNSFIRSIFPTAALYYDFRRTHGLKINLAGSFLMYSAWRLFPASVFAQDS